MSHRLGYWLAHVNVLAICGVLLGAFRGCWPLLLAVEQARVGLAGCRISARRRYPSTGQLLADPSLPLPFRRRHISRYARKAGAT